MAVELPVIHSTHQSPAARRPRPRPPATPSPRALSSPAAASSGTARGAIAIAAGAVAGSIALIAFGADSLIEALAGIIVLWRFAPPAPTPRPPSAAPNSSSRSPSGCSPHTSPSTRPSRSPAATPREQPGRDRPLDHHPDRDAAARQRQSQRRPPAHSHAGHSESRQNMLCAYLSAALLDRLTSTPPSAGGGPTRSPRSSSPPSPPAKDARAGAARAAAPPTAAALTRPRPPHGAPAPPRGAPRLRLVASRAGALLRTQAHPNLLGRCRDQQPASIRSTRRRTASSPHASALLWRQFQETHTEFMRSLLVGVCWLMKPCSAGSAERNRAAARGRERATLKRPGRPGA